jgi:hypothetical protein
MGEWGVGCGRWEEQGRKRPKFLSPSPDLPISPFPIPILYLNTRFNPVQPIVIYEIASSKLAKLVLTPVFSILSLA